MSSTKSLIIAGIAVIIAAGIIISIMDSDNSIAIEDKPDTTSQQMETLNWNNLHENVRTTFTEAVVLPEIESKAFIHPFAVVIGDCYIGKMVFVAPTAVCRGDEGTPIYVGENSNLQDGAVLHALKTTNDGSNIDGMKFSSDGERLNGDDSRFESGYAIWIGDRVSLAHGSQVHGPAWVGDDTFIGMEALIFNAKLGNNVSIGVAATVTDGVEIADNKFVPPGRVIVTQAEADALPDRIGSGAYETINQGVVDVNMQLTEGFNQIDIEKLILERERLMEERMLETAQSAP
jgi:carbon dioxide concentrating mechanism protein CcmM